MHLRTQLKLKLATLSLAMLSFGSVASAVEPASGITVEGVYHFLDNRSANSVGALPGLVQQAGAVSVVPNGADGTTGWLEQGAFSTQLFFQPSSFAPNHFARAADANFVPDGAWNLHFDNGQYHASAVTPTIFGAVKIPFAANVAISGGGASPTFTWKAPATANLDRVRVQIWDVENFIGQGGVNGNGIANVIYINSNLPTSTTSFTVSANDPLLAAPLQNNHHYALEISFLDLRDANGDGGNSNILSRSRSFFDFTLLSAGAPADVFLPTVSGAGTGQPVYQFTSIDVTAGQQVFIDPLVAVGYDYQIGAGDPNFASVTLPTGVGDSQYELLLWDGSKWVVAGMLNGGNEHVFASGGVDRFRVQGIETEANLDPNNSTAFITGLTFSATGTFTGTMTPLVTSVPEPTSVAMMLAGLALIGGVARSRAKRA